MREAGNPLRNSQYFSYDDLDRLTEAVYSFALPGDPPREDASIRYRHDRIGNLIEQRSDWIQEDRDQPVANLGTMHYGGEAGAHGRDGRAPDDPPGPEALTRIEKNGDVRDFLYDDAGNMRQLDGLSLTWNYRNQLAAAEDDFMRTDYGYDHTGRRVAKRIWRKDDEGVLPAAPRHQFFRIQEGWNLYAMGVAAEDAAAQFGIGANEALSGAFLFDAESGDYLPLTGESPLPAGSLFWVYSETTAPRHCSEPQPFISQSKR